MTDPAALQTLRNKASEKLQDPAVKGIRLCDLCHYFATMTYHKTGDILFVKQQMGRRKIETTLIYAQLLQFDKDDNYTCKIAQNVEQATDLIENGLVRHRKGRTQTIQKTQITPFFLFNHL